MEKIKVTRSYNTHFLLLHDYFHLLQVMIKQANDL